jgi:hypothetical protein
MATGRRAVAAILGAGALGAAAAAVWASQKGGAGQEEGAPIATEMRTALESATAASLRSVQDEVAAAAAIPQLEAALHNRVDAATIQDLFENEAWWEPYRGRAVMLTAPHGMLVTRNAPAAGLAADDMAARAVSGRASGRFAVTGDRAWLEAAIAVEQADVPRWSLLLARPIDGALAADWAKAARGELVVSDGRRALLGEGAPAAATLIGRESEPVVVDNGAGFVATPVTLAPGVWLWGVRALPASVRESKATPAQFGVLAAALAFAAVVLILTGRRQRQPTAMPAGPLPGTPPTFQPQAPLGSMVGVEPLPRTPVPAGSVSLSRSHPGSMPTAIAAAGGEPQVFGRYTVIDRLGEGGMCELFIVGMAGPEGFQRTLVLKRLKPEIARVRAAVDQFIDEAKLGSTLIHNNIVPIYDFGHVADGYYIAEEYVVGRDVGQVVQRHVERVGQPLEMRLVFYIAHEALAGLGYAHDRINDAGEPLNIVHRDVSPGNILVSALGEVKLIDFGIAKAEGRVSHTDLGNVKGNASFMAPEQARGLNIDRRTDLFSLGLVMYYALTGEPLYKGSSTAEVFYAAASGPSAERLARLGKLPPVVAQVLGRALAPDPTDRYANAEEFAADLVDHITPGTRNSMATLLNALFGPELRPLSGGAGGAGSGTSAVRRKLA